MWEFSTKETSSTLSSAPSAWFYIAGSFLAKEPCLCGTVSQKRPPALCVLLRQNGSKFLVLVVVSFGKRTLNRFVLCSRIIGPCCLDCLLSVCVCVCVCVILCVREREIVFVCERKGVRERERGGGEKGREGGEGWRERERETERERRRERERGRERNRESEREREKERKRECEKDRMSVCV